MSDQRGALRHVVVVGASLAGLRACETLRQEGFGGPIVLVGDETEMPYDRPPLSKKLLAGDWDADRIRLRKADDVDGLELDLRLGSPAVSLDTSAHTVTLGSGASIEYDALVIATGATVRTLPGQPSWPGVHALRTLGDSLSLRADLAGRPDGSRPAVTVIGAGFIGLEVAATARQLGCEVTVLEGLPSPLVRALGTEMGTAVASVHGRHGVEIRCGVTVTGLVGDESGVRGVALDGGEVVPSDVVVVGIGVTPATQWLEGSGLELSDGVVCDAALRASVAGVFAAGDCVRWHNRVFDPHDDAVMRIEHWTNAAEQGAAAARSLLAVAEGREPEPYEAVPFFWSDQFESRIQFVGRPHGGDEVRVISGDLDGAFSALYGWQGRLRGVLGVSRPKQVMPFRALIARGASWDEALEFASTLPGL
jgi:NADPH-dependent 2,4-dienoyl-CoA reductase/sulfur reductase-like enzyme